MVTNASSYGITILYTTHYLYEAEQICNRIGIIDEGKLLVEGTIKELRKITSENDIVIIRGEFTKDILQKKLTETQINGAEIISCEEGTANISIPSGEHNITLLFKSLSRMMGIKEFNIKQASLETLFIKLSGKELREN